jgi:ubiquinone/menaquinone biosynthesis C-methylase UbiE
MREGEPVYDAAAWAAGPQRIYDRLARAAMQLVTTDVAGTTVLEVGAGTGAMTQAVLARGASVVATDMSTGMLGELRRQVDSRIPVTAADSLSLPFRDASFDGTVASFVVNHLAEPAQGIAEMNRVTSDGRLLLATTFATDDDNPVKLSIEQVLKRRGWAQPDWYTELKAHRMPLTGSVSAFERAAEAAKVADFAVHAVSVRFDDVAPTAVAAYRLGMTHVSGFVADLEPTERTAVLEEATDAADRTKPLVLPMLVLVRGG